MAEVATAMSLGELLRMARLRLADAGIDNAALDARLILEHFSKTSRVDALARPDMPIDDAAVDAVSSAIERRCAGEPVYRILGFRDFHGLRLELNADTLEPRPDTETLVDMVVPVARSLVEKHGACRILDLGTGSGAIALALLHEVAGAIALGADISPRALAMAANNADINGLSQRFSTIESDWCSAVTGRFHIIVSNPPYIPSRDMSGLQAEVRLFDPHRALDGGVDGLGPYRTIAAQASAFLEADGGVAVEIGKTRKTDVSAVFAECGYRLTEMRRDLKGIDRALFFAREAPV